MIAENPTRGLDVAATAATHAHLLAMRDAGAAVVVYSNDLDEVLDLADRIVVMHAGIAREVPADRAAIALAMLGGARVSEPRRTRPARGGVSCGGAGTRALVQRDRRRAGDGRRVVAERRGRGVAHDGGAARLRPRHARERGVHAGRPLERAATRRVERRARRREHRGDRAHGALGSRRDRLAPAHRRRARRRLSAGDEARRRMVAAKDAGSRSERSSARSRSAPRRRTSCASSCPRVRGACCSSPRRCPRSVRRSIFAALVRPGPYQAPSSPLDRRVARRHPPRSRGGARDRGLSRAHVGALRDVELGARLLDGGGARARRTGESSGAHDVRRDRHRRPRLHRRAAGRPTGSAAPRLPSARWW